MHQRTFVFLALIFSATAAGAQQLAMPVTDSMGFSKRLRPHPSYTSPLGYFCKKELQLQKLTRVNVYFRLGSKEYVDYLERKPNAKKY